MHLSEQVAENDACLAAYGVTPTRLLHEADLLGPDTTVVHATHLTGDDIELLGTTGTNVCITPTTERDLADGIGPAAGCTAPAAGSPSAATATRWSTRSRSCAAWRWTSGSPPASAATGAPPSCSPSTATRARSEPAIEVGAPADLVTLDTASPRTAGTGADEHTAAFAATAADVVQVVADGRVVYTKGDDEEIGRELDEAIGALWPRR